MELHKFVAWGILTPPAMDIDCNPNAASPLAEVWTEGWTYRLNEHTYGPMNALKGRTGWGVYGGKGMIISLPRVATISSVRVQGRPQDDGCDQGTQCSGCGKVRDRLAQGFRVSCEDSGGGWNQCYEGSICVSSCISAEVTVPLCVHSIALQD